VNDLFQHILQMNPLIWVGFGAAYFFFVLKPKQAQQAEESATQQETKVTTVETTKEAKVPVVVQDNSELSSLVSVQDLSSLLALLSKASQDKEIDISITYGSWQYSIRATKMPEAK